MKSHTYISRRHLQDFITHGIDRSNPFFRVISNRNVSNHIVDKWRSLNSYFQKEIKLDTDLVKQYIHEEVKRQEGYLAACKAKKDAVS